jgi:Ser/Thr protein kinase RdoA (MazF antagonist)
VKPFEELTQRGRVRRYRQLAQVALEAYGLSDARLTFIRDAGNITFRVVAPRSGSGSVGRERYAQNRFVLRMHQPAYQSDAAILSELEWLVALCRDTDLAVPEPVRTSSGELAVEVKIPGVPECRRCSLLRWMTGRMLTQGLRPYHLKALGRLMAGLHEHAANWHRPAGFARPRYDWDGLFGNNDFVKVPASDIRSRMPRPYLEPFEFVTRRVRQVMDELGEGPDVFGLIHADISLGDNVLFGGGEARIIDFDDCVYGYWVYDAAVALSSLPGDSASPRYRAALLEGYAEIRSVPEEQWTHLDLFVAAWHAFEMVWATAGGILYPRARPNYDRWVERAAGDMMRCLALLSNPVRVK